MMNRTPTRHGLLRAIAAGENPSGARGLPNTSANLLAAGAIEWPDNLGEPSITDLGRELLARWDAFTAR